jgi:hypothetical protein
MCLFNVICVFILDSAIYLSIDDTYNLFYILSYKQFTLTIYELSLGPGEKLLWLATFVSFLLSKTNAMIVPQLRSPPLPSTLLPTRILLIFMPDSTQFFVT